MGFDVERINRMEHLPFTFLKEIGRGKFGAVYEGENKQTGERRALKVVRKETKIGKTECEVMDLLPKHPNLIEMESRFVIEEYGLCVFVLDLCQTDLRAHIRSQGGKLEGEEARILMKGIVQGLQVLQESNIFHRDLKPENILLSISEDGETITPKVADFGLAKVLRRSDELFRTFTGSPFYLAPEVWAQQGYTARADIYSCGVIFYEMLTGNPLYSTCRNKLQLKRQVLHGGMGLGDLEELRVEEEGKVLLWRMLKRDVTVRVDWEELFAHPWLLRN